MRGHTIVRKTARASCARPAEPSALMSAFSRAVSTLKPLPLMSCRACYLVRLISWELTSRDLLNNCRLPELLMGII